VIIKEDLIWIKSDYFSYLPAKWLYKGFALKAIYKIK
jgi:hypothetical protein